MTIESVAHLRTARRYLTSVLLNFPFLDQKQTSVSTLLGLLDHFADHPDDYQTFIHDRTKTSQDPGL
jgi:hypothetical protein